MVLWVWLIVLIAKFLLKAIQYYSTEWLFGGFRERTIPLFIRVRLVVFCPEVTVNFVPVEKVD